SVAPPVRLADRLIPGTISAAAPLAFIGAGLESTSPNRRSTTCLMQKAIPVFIPSLFRSSSLYCIRSAGLQKAFVCLHAAASLPQVSHPPLTSHPILAALPRA